MTRTGSHVSRIAALMVGAGLALAGIGILAGLTTLIIGASDPQLFAGVRGTVNGQPVDLADPDRLPLFAGMVCIACAGAALILWQLLGMLRSAAAGSPFTLDNVRRLRTLAGLFAAYAVVPVLARLLAGPEIRSLLKLKEPGLELSPILMALVSFVLSEVFREGIRLREDAEGTV